MIESRKATIDECGDWMGIEHSFKDEPRDTMRCPGCGHVSTVKVEDTVPYIGLSDGMPSGDYFICQNPACFVERIYGENCVMVGGAIR